MLKSEEVFISLLLSPVFPAALMIKACKFAWIHEARASALVRLSPWTWCSLSYLLYFPLIKVRRWTGRRKMKKLPSPLYPTQSIQFRKHVENDTLQRPFSQGLNDFYWCQQRNLVANGFQTRIQIRQCCWWSSPSCDSPLYRRGTSTLLDDIYLSIFSTMRKNYANQELYLYEMDETFHSKALSFFFFLQSLCWYAENIVRHRSKVSGHFDRFVVTMCEFDQSIRFMTNYFFLMVSPDYKSKLSIKKS